MNSSAQILVRKAYLFQCMRAAYPDYLNVIHFTMPRVLGAEYKKKKTNTDEE
jgi:hypothetical protein